MKHLPRRPTRNVNVTPTNSVVDFLRLSIGLLVLLLGGYWALGVVVDIVMQFVPLEREQRLVKSILFKLPVDSKVDHPAYEKLRDIVNRLKQNTGLPDFNYGVFIHDSPVPNAFALPGGYIGVTRGLLDSATSENEIAFVVSHEMGHVLRRHSFRHLGRGLLVALLSSAILGDGAKLTEIVTPTLELTDLKYSREQESEADIIALELLYAAYGHVNGATDFFARVVASGHEAIDVEMLSTHPLSQHRIDTLNRLISEKGYPLAKKLPLLPGTPQLVDSP